jgi:hypothetical protein
MWLEEEELVNQVDVGIQLTFDDDTAMAIATDGFRFNLSVYRTTEQIEQLHLKSLPISLEARFG